MSLSSASFRVDFAVSSAVRLTPFETSCSVEDITCFSCFQFELQCPLAHSRPIGALSISALSVNALSTTFELTLGALSITFELILGVGTYQHTFISTISIAAAI